MRRMMHTCKTPFSELLETGTMEELLGANTAIVETIRLRRDEADIENRKVLRVGDRVTFERRGYPVPAVIVEFRRTKAIVNELSHRGEIVKRWKISPSLLRKAE